MPLFLQKSAGCLSPNATLSPIAHRQLSKLPVVFTVEEQVDGGCTAPITYLLRGASPDQAIRGAFDSIQPGVVQRRPPQVIHGIQIDVAVGMAEAKQAIQLREVFGDDGGVQR